MRKSFFLLILWAFIFSFNITVLADEGGGHEEDIKKAAQNFQSGRNETHPESSSHGDQEEVHLKESPIEGKSNNGRSEGVSNSVDSNDHKVNTHEEEGSNHEESGDHKEDGGHNEETVVEPGPDYMVLGAFGTVNLSFLLIGVWNKWLRRKGE